MLGLVSKLVCELQSSNQTLRRDSYLMLTKAVGTTHLLTEPLVRCLESLFDGCLGVTEEHRVTHYVGQKVHRCIHGCLYSNVAVKHCVERLRGTVLERERGGAGSCLVWNYINNEPSLL